MKNSHSKFKEMKISRTENLNSTVCPQKKMVDEILDQIKFNSPELNSS